MIIIMANQERIITYVPQAESRDELREMDVFRRGIWLYTNRLGQNYSAVLAMSLAYQVFVAVFIGIRLVYSLSIIPKGLPEVLALIIACLIGLFFQGLILFEAGQVVWLRRTDRLKNLLEQDSYWWYVIVTVLVLLVTLDFLLLIMAVTGTPDLFRAWQVARTDHATFIADALLLALNLMTILRCASVMRTSTSEQNQREIEERLRAIADEILLEAGDSVKAEMQQIWRQLSLDPRRFLPLQKAVLNLIQQQHPDMFPEGLGGDTWAYDFSANNFTALPPHLHQALLAGRSNRYRFKDSDAAHLWSLPPQDLAQAISFNLHTYGDPRFVNALDPAAPEFAFNPVDFKRAFALQSPPPISTSARSKVAAENILAGLNLVNPAEERFADKPSFIQALGQRPAEMVRFASYLMNVAAPKKLEGQQYVAGQGVTIFDLFDLLELQFYYREFTAR